MMLMLFLSEWVHAIVIGDLVFDDVPSGQDGSYELLMTWTLLPEATSTAASCMTTVNNNLPSQYRKGQHVDAYTQRSRNCKNSASLQSRTFIPCVAPGYNDCGRGGKYNAHSLLSQPVWANALGRSRSFGHCCNRGQSPLGYNSQKLRKKSMG